VNAASKSGLYRKLPFDPVKDFDGVITAVSGIYVLAVHPGLPFNSVAELSRERWVVVWHQVPSTRC